MRNNVIFTIVVLVIGLSGGYWFANKNPNQTENFAAEETGPKPLFYRHPTKPGMTSPTPKSDEMGMNYVPVYANDAKNDNAVKGTVTIDPVTTQNINLPKSLPRLATLLVNLQ